MSRRGTPQVDFTSSLYLGFQHRAADLGSWRRLLSGRPAALEEPPLAARLGDRLARLAGAEAGVVYPSSLHAFVDLWATLHRRELAVAVDGAAYPIGHLPLDRTRVTQLPHYDVDALGAFVRRAPKARRPVILVDGYCPSCGRIAPLKEMATRVEARGGLVVVDDTQALGVFGREAAAHPPYGLGGSGSLRYTATPSANVIVVSSLGKAFGAPLAVVSGPRWTARALRCDGPTREHTSPPSAVALAAGERALHTNANTGDQLRRRLAALVARFRDGVADLRIPLTVQSHHPMQAIGGPLEAVSAMHGVVTASGVRSLPLRNRCRRGVALSFIITAGHRPSDIDRALDAIGRASIDVGLAS